MYPTWGNYGAPQSQNYGGAGPRKPLAGSHTGQAPGFGGFEASSSGSLFSSLQEQHLQQMQQLQMLHQKQLQSVLQHGNNASTAAPAYGVAHAGGYVGSSWRPEGPAHVDSGAGAQSYFKPEETSATRVPPAPKQGHQQPPPLPPQPHPTDTQPVPPPPEPQPSKPPENSSPPKPKEAPTAEDEKSLPLQEQQQLWYKQHLQNLQKLKQERAKQNQKDGDGSFPLPPPPGKTAPPPPPLEPPKSTPPPPPPKEEPPTPPPLPEEVRSENVGKPPTFTDTPEVPKDPEEAARLQQLQAAAAHWQQVQQQRAGLQYQALMQQHEKLQQILEQYQRLIQQPANLQSMSAELQLRHYEMQQQQFTPLFQDWNHSFTLWYEQFQSYPHKDQLQDYGHQWKQWKEQMNATNAHLQERVATLTAMVPFASSQYNSGMMGQYGQYPVQDTPLQQSVNPGMQQTPVTVGPRLQGPQFDQPPNRFDGPPRFDQPRHRFDGPPRFDQQRQRFDGPARFDQPRFGQPPRFDSTRLTGPSPRLECPPNLQEKQQQGMLPKVEPVTPQPPTPDSKTPEKSSDKPLSENEKDKLKLVDKSGFFVQSEPIPQTLQTDTKPEDSNSSVTLDKGEKSEPVNSKPPVNTSSAVTSNTTTQNSQKPDGPLGNSKPPQIPKSSGIQPEPQKQSKLDPPKPPPGRGRGQPPVPSQVRGRGRGQRSSGEFKGQNTVPIGEEMGEMPYDYMPPEENVGMQEEQENYYWQDPSHEQFGGEESEMPPEEMWMPEEHHFTEEEYYQEPIGGPHMGRGRPPMMRGRPPMPRGGPPMGRGGPPMGRGGPLMGRGGPPMGRGGPPMGRGGPPMGRGGPPMVRGGPPMVRGGPPMGRGGPPMSRGGPPMARGGPPMARGVDRRSYPDDRGPPTAPPVPPPQPPPRVEKKPEIKNIDDILKLPGRLSRPERIVIIMRGLPGSGKTHVAKLIRDKEVECGGAPPRVLVLDDYFMTEVEKVEKDPDTGKRVKKKAMEYEYELEMEDTYRSSMLKTFKKTLDDGFFPFIILDTINDRVKHFDQFWSAAKTKGFEVYLAEITADTQTCAKRNVHGRTLKDIMKMSNNWEPSPRHMVRLDVRSLLQDAAIEEVEMEDFNPDDEPKEPKREEEEESDLGYIPKSKWEMDTSEAKLDKLDGLGSGGKRKREGEHMAGLEDYLQLPDDYATRMSEPGKKRVRWADLEEQKDADRKRAIGFVVGQTDWEKITDESGQLAQRALNRTKYF
uniref:YLP motif-containing protein 1 n=1 Tax=Astatotilapia calliptera TaxID=8154 RepID=A0AAX7VGU2_ASTCA